ncbi:cytochrome c oxidase subunit 3 [Exilibacterium tricleocarpae]|uniref:cytochrome-c oxidase n=1 Tax=Exilibacterium tricleocarpae TaxID=2591008 RepID=A0A545T0G5_9GAMM|nr:cytochrome c oxidase subunit 3 [Exilibacterium tricleocarpae]TQV70712.1 cytochrome c oxidase subunit 3 [Exilibacterium tricleocarpae]
MASEGTYYVPEQSKLPILASLGLFLTVFGAASWLNGNDSGPTVFFCGGVLFAYVLWVWFSTVISENMAGLNDAQLKRSYVWGMGWFIFSEVMFFAAFFGALWYVRNLALPWLGGEGDGAATNEFLWKGFENTWPLMTTPDMAVNGDAARVTGPEQSMSFSQVDSIWTWLPFWNTVILLTSSVTVHFAHTALKNAKRSAFNSWLGLTVLLGIIFLVLQVWEYIHAYNDLGLTLQSGIYGTTFFMLTGFHGAHVTLGTFMLLVMFLRSVLKGHFKHDDCFGFESASWYWHFVDVVWVGLFIFIYILG